MSRIPFSKRSWYPHAVAACVAVLLYVLLTQLGNILGSIGTFIGYFSTVIQGFVIAYLVAPLSRLYQRSLFRAVRRKKVRDLLSNALSFLTVILLVVFFLILLIPQLISSITTFAENLGGYAEAFAATLERLDLSAFGVDSGSLISSSEDILHNVTVFVRNNVSSIVSTTRGLGQSLMQWLIAFLLSMYLLSEKEMLKNGIKRLLKALLPDSVFERSLTFFSRCDAILSRYIIYSLMDSVIVGVANIIFMTAFRMPYVGLVSFIVAALNLIPTFGPMIGALLGAFILLMAEPLHAAAFLIFTFFLQTVDGYILKPRLFGGTLGVPGLFILTGVIVGGKMFGVVGILLAIPGVAILDFIYREYLLPGLEARKRTSV